MLSTPYNGVQPVRLKSGNESGGGWGSSGTKFLATVRTIAVGEPTPAGEIAASVITVVVGGILLYEVVACSKSQSEEDSSSCLIYITKVVWLVDLGITLIVEGMVRLCVMHVMSIALARKFGIVHVLYNKL